MKEIKIKNFPTRIEAEIGKTMLRSHGIESFLQLEGVHSSGIPNETLGVDLYVLEKNMEKARELLESDEKNHGK